MKKMVLIATYCLMSICAISCGGGIGGSKLDIKLGGKDTGLAVKSSGADMSVKTFTDTAGKMTTASAFYAILANFDMDTTSIATMKKPLTAPDQVRLALQMIGVEGTDQKAELKPGTYVADPKVKFMKIDSLTVSTFADGKETTATFDTNFTGSKITGQARVTSVTADTISGEIDVTDGDKSVKGPFTVKRTKK